MNCETTYNPVPRLTRWMRFQVWAYDRYSVDAGLMVSTMVCAFVMVIVLGGVAVWQLN